jgi:hypothetical protein
LLFADVLAPAGLRITANSNQHHTIAIIATNTTPSSTTQLLNP